MTWKDWLLVVLIGTVIFVVMMAMNFMLDWFKYKGLEYVGYLVYWFVPCAVVGLFAAWPYLYPPEEESFREKTVDKIQEKWERDDW